MSSIYDGYRRFKMTGEMNEYQKRGMRILNKMVLDSLGRMGDDNG